MSMTSPEMTESDILVDEEGYGKLDYVDEKMLCSLACQCKAAPDTTKTKKGKTLNLKQICMSNKIDFINNTTSNSLTYKAEVSYDMTQTPPRPILESRPPLGKAPQKHQSWLGWLKKYWGDSEMNRPEYQTGMIRRPDIIIVHNPQDSPVQQNIKQVVEVKFPNDPIRDGQEDDYQEIAGSKSKLVFLHVDDCSCETRDTQRQPAPEPVPAPSTEPAPERYKFTADAELEQMEQGIIVGLIAAMFEGIVVGDAMTSR